MGIPAYYTYLIKKHRKILVELSKADHFYIDGNSTIYDVVNSFSFDLTQSMEENELNIILLVVQKIKGYIELVSPQTTTITFDGIAPFAKLCQQRERRFKSHYQNKIKKQIFKKPIVSDFWDTAKITPGTPFMKRLTEIIKEHFVDNVLACDVPGEGEHKIFEILRLKGPNNDKHVIYGLDSDLIMLSMLHLDICPNIFLYRETPLYIKTIDSTLDETQNYFMDISSLSQAILNEMGGNIIDYVFISFMMGNDFMPHFPSLNIRTGGINKIISAYTETQQIVTIDRLNNNIVIDWENFYQFIHTLSLREEEYIKTEYNLREKKHTFNGDTPEIKWRKYENLPNTERSVEKYINPNISNWENRYYDALFDDCNPKHYIDALIWNLTYYLFGCPDFNWSYPYQYPPLLIDLLPYIPREKQHILWEKKENTISDIEQLCYVLPKGSLHILPEDIRCKLNPEWYVEDCDFTWAFCKYFWESHVELPKIDFDVMKKIIK
jgi:5'-3' exonuclease